MFKKDIFEQKRGGISKENSRPLDVDAGLLHDIREYLLFPFWLKPEERPDRTFVRRTFLKEDKITKLGNFRFMPAEFC